MWWNNVWFHRRRTSKRRTDWLTKGFSLDQLKSWKAPPGMCGLSQISVETWSLIKPTPPSGRGDRHVLRQIQQGCVATHMRKAQQKPQIMTWDLPPSWEKSSSKQWPWWPNLISATMGILPRITNGTSAGNMWISSKKDFTSYPLVNIQKASKSYWTSPFIVELPIENRDFP